MQNWRRISPTSDRLGVLHRTPVASYLPVPTNLYECAEYARGRRSRRVGSHYLARQFPFSRRALCYAERFKTRALDLRALHLSPRSTGRQNFCRPFSGGPIRLRIRDRSAHALDFHIRRARGCPLILLPFSSRRE